MLTRINNLLISNRKDFANHHQKILLPISNTSGTDEHRQIPNTISEITVVTVSLTL